MQGLALLGGPSRPPRRHMGAVCGATRPTPAALSSRGQPHAHHRARRLAAYQATGQAGGVPPRAPRPHARQPDLELRVHQRPVPPCKEHKARRQDAQEQARLDKLAKTNPRNNVARNLDVNGSGGFFASLGQPGEACCRTCQNGRP